MARKKRDEPLIKLLSAESDYLSDRGWTRSAPREGTRKDGVYWDKAGRKNFIQRIAVEVQRREDDEHR